MVYGCHKVIHTTNTRPFMVSSTNGKKEIAYYTSQINIHPAIVMPEQNKQNISYCIMKWETRIKSSVISL